MQGQGQDEEPKDGMPSPAEGTVDPGIRPGTERSLKASLEAQRVKTIEEKAQINDQSKAG